MVLAGTASLDWRSCSVWDVERTVYRTIERLRLELPEPERPFAHLANQQPRHLA
jgi:hypothetical protein